MECRDPDQISIPDQIDMETQVLDLSGINLQILSREVFARHGLLNLQKLHLSSCKIGQIDPTAFRGLTNLVELNLSGNLLTSVPTATFADIPYLRVLQLHHNQLQKVEANAFEMIPQLVSLDLSHCGIKKVAAKAFAQLTSLEKLFLQHNQITELRQKTVESITGLHVIELANNPWGCDCRLRPLKNWLISNNVPYSVDPKCAQPPRLAGQQFANLQVDEFACPPKLLSAPRYVEANMGENATLSCKIGSVPSSKVQWYRDGTEILNNSLVNRGQQQFVIQETGGFEKTSTLVLTQARPEDSGPFMCVSQNQAGRVEANFTLQVGYFVGGVASLESGQIAGIAVTFASIALVLLVFLLVFLLRHRHCSSSMVLCSSRNNKQTSANGHLQVEKANANGHVIHQTLNDNGSLERISPTTTEATNVTNFVQHQQQSSRPPAAIPARSRPIEAAADSGFGLLTPSQGNGLINGTPTPLQGSNNSPDLIRGSPITRHSYVNQAVNFSPAHLQQQNQIVRPSPTRILSTSTTLPRNHLGSDQLYPEEYGVGYPNNSGGGGYFNPLEAMTSSPLRSRSPFRTLPRGPPTDPRLAGMYQAINPLKDYGYPSDYGLPMTAAAFNGIGHNSSITSNPLSEFDEELEIASYNNHSGSGNHHHHQQQQQPQPQHLVPKNNNLSSGSSTLSPPPRGPPGGGQLSSTSGIGDLSTASGALTNNSSFDAVQINSPTLLTTNSSATPTPTGSSSSTGGGGGLVVGNGLYAKINKTKNGIQHPSSNGGGGIVRSKRESPDEGIQDDVSTDV